MRFRFPPNTDLDAMVATLRSYDRVFGPRHIQTLALTAQIAQTLHSLGERRMALSLLERVVRDLDKVARTHATRITALHGLRILLTEASQWTRAIAVQREIAECLALTGSADAAAARAALEELIMSSDAAQAA
ncbi:MAG TPA: hypothetical protein VHZ74_21980 [Bryobacteraceae bacterium]|jgi:hypothetical protein|nr:hypothetical protein [Bryobacteraceae bacterium]